MQAIVKAAASMRRTHLAIGQPMKINEGFKEANIAHDVSAAFRKEGYYVFPEFPFSGGSIDAVFIRDGEVVVCEWKRMHRRSALDITEQTARMLRFDPRRELADHGFQITPSVSRCLWVCDSWFDEDVEWWFGRSSPIRPPRPFDATWSLGKEDFPSLRFQKYPDEKWTYSWLWAWCEKRLTSR